MFIIVSVIVSPYCITMTATTRKPPTTTNQIKVNPDSAAGCLTTHIRSLGPTPGIETNQPVMSHSIRVQTHGGHFHKFTLPMAVAYGRWLYTYPSEKYQSVGSTISNK